MTKHMHKILYAAVLLLTGAFSTAALAVMPSNEYACEVRAEGGRLGLVLVQADTRAQASSVAIGATAKTMDGIDSVARSVVQCVDSPRGKFGDFQFQQFYESTPR